MLTFFFFFFLSWEFLLHIPCWLLRVGSFSYTSHAGFIFISGVSHAHPVLASFLSGEFLLHIPGWLYFSVGSFSYTYYAGFLFSIWGVFLKHPVLDSFLCGEFSLTYIPCWLCFMWGVSLSLTHPVLPSFLCGEFFIACWLHFYAGSFSYTSRAGFIIILGVSLTHPVLAYFLFNFI